MKKIILFLAVLLNAKIVDMVIASVNNEPITSYELQKTQKMLHLSKNQALNYLIDQKILKEELKKRGIEVDEFDIENSMEKIASKNGLSLFEFKRILQQRGELEQFKKQLRENLQKQKLFAQIINSKLKVSEEEMKTYYENHKDEFSVFKTIQVTEYRANNPQILQKIRQNPLSNEKVSVKTKVYSYNELPKRLMFLFKNTKVGEFTPIINDGMGYLMYYVARKDSKVVLPYDEVKDIIYNKLLAQKREEILKNYFEKLKNRANIKFYN